jgi:choline dehydrogenase-like flavoprotein
VFRLFSPSGTGNLRLMVYELGFSHGGETYYLAGQKQVQNDRAGTDLWNDTTTLYTKLHKGTDTTGQIVGAGVLRLGIPALTKLASTIRVLNAEKASDHARALGEFGRFFMGNLWETYGPKRT